MANEGKKWRRFENLAAAIQRSLAPRARVEQDVRVIGKVSGVERQIDIAVRTTAGQFELLIAIDCKDYGTKVDVKDVEAFIGLVKDVGASQGALVTAEGYTAAAKTVADAAGLRLFTLVDAESQDWPVFVSIPVLVDECYIAGVNYTLSSTELLELEAGDLSTVPVYRADGTRRGPLRDLLYTLWNEETISRDPGEYKSIRLSTEPTFFLTKAGPAEVELNASIRVARRLYFGYLPLVKVRGFRDDLEGSLLTRSITTDEIDIKVVRDTWQTIPSKDALAVRPVIRLGVAACYSLENETNEDAVERHSGSDGAVQQGDEADEA